MSASRRVGVGLLPVKPPMTAANGSVPEAGSGALPMPRHSSRHLPATHLRVPFQRVRLVVKGTEECRFLLTMPMEARVVDLYEFVKCNFQMIIVALCNTDGKSHRMAPSFDLKLRTHSDGLDYFCYPQELLCKLLTSSKDVWLIVLMQVPVAVATSEPLPASEPMPVTGAVAQTQPQTEEQKAHSIEPMQQESASVPEFEAPVPLGLARKSEALEVVQKKESTAPKKKPMEERKPSISIEIAPRRLPVSGSKAASAKRGKTESSGSAVRRPSMRRTKTPAELHVGVVSSKLSKDKQLKKRPDLIGVQTKTIADHLQKIATAKAMARERKKLKKELFEDIPKYAAIIAKKLWETMVKGEFTHLLVNPSKRKEAIFDTIRCSLPHLIVDDRFVHEGDSSHAVVDTATATGSVQVDDDAIQVSFGGDKHKAEAVQKSDERSDERDAESGAQPDAVAEDEHVEKDDDTQSEKAKKHKRKKGRGFFLMDRSSFKAKGGSVPKREFEPNTPNSDEEFAKMHKEFPESELRLHQYADANGGIQIHGDVSGRFREEDDEVLYMGASQEVPESLLSSAYGHGFEDDHRGADDIRSQKKRKAKSSKSPSPDVIKSKDEDVAVYRPREPEQEHVEHGHVEAEQEHVPVEDAAEKEEEENEDATLEYIKAKKRIIQFLKRKASKHRSAPLATFGQLFEKGLLAEWPQREFVHVRQWLHWLATFEYDPTNPRSAVSARSGRFFVYEFVHNSRQLTETTLAVSLLDPLSSGQPDKNLAANVEHLEMANLVPKFTTDDLKIYVGNALRFLVVEKRKHDTGCIAAAHMTQGHEELLEFLSTDDLKFLTEMLQNVISQNAIDGPKALEMRMTEWMPLLKKEMDKHKPEAGGSESIEQWQVREVMADKFVRNALRDLFEPFCSLASCNRDVDHFLPRYKTVHGDSAQFRLQNVTEEMTGGTQVWWPLTFHWNFFPAKLPLCFKLARALDSCFKQFAETVLRLRCSAMDLSLGTDAEGCTLLIFSAYKGLEQVVEYLVETGCDTRAKNKYGETAVDAADAALQKTRKSGKIPHHALMKGLSRDEMQQRWEHIKDLLIHASVKMKKKKKTAAAAAATESVMASAAMDDAMVGGSAMDVAMDSSLASKVAEDTTDSVTEENVVVVNAPVVEVFLADDTLEADGIDEEATENEEEEVADKAEAGQIEEEAEAGDVIKDDAAAVQNEEEEDEVQKEDAVDAVGDAVAADDEEEVEVGTEDVFDELGDDVIVEETVVAVDAEEVVAVDENEAVVDVGTEETEPEQGQTEEENEEENEDENDVKEELRSEQKANEMAAETLPSDKRKRVSLWDTAAASSASDSSMVDEMLEDDEKRATIDDRSLFGEETTAGAPLRGLDEDDDDEEDFDADSVAEVAAGNGAVDAGDVFSFGASAKGSQNAAAQRKESSTLPKVESQATGPKQVQRGYHRLQTGYEPCTPPSSDDD